MTGLKKNGRLPAPIFNHDMVVVPDQDCPDR